jgi:hypothetical protein
LDRAEVVRKFIKLLLEWELIERDKRKGELHLTDLTSPCIRQLYFSKKENGVEDIPDLIRAWEGKMLHEFPLLEQHELELEYMGVKTSIDEYDPNTGTLIEKKFVSFMPKDEGELKKYYAHYIEQVEYEALFLIKNGKVVNDAFLLFVCRGEPEQGRPYINAFRIPIDVASVERRFNEKVEVVKLILDRGEPPEIPQGFMPFDYPCTYCGFRGRCWGLG